MLYNTQFQQSFLSFTLPCEQGFLYVPSLVKPVSTNPCGQHCIKIFCNTFRSIASGGFYFPSTIWTFSIFFPLKVPKVVIQWSLKSSGYPTGLSWKKQQKLDKKAHSKTSTLDCPQTNDSSSQQTIFVLRAQCHVVPVTNTQPQSSTMTKQNICKIYCENIQAL